MREIFDVGIQNPGPWNLEYSCRNPESGIQDSTEKDLESGIHGVDSKIQDYLGFSYIGREKKQETKGKLPILRPYLRLQIIFSNKV